jgi:hypothetical protein
MSAAFLGLAAEADARIRTADPFITSEVLYQLSYVGETDRLYRVPRRVSLAFKRLHRAGGAFIPRLR